MWLRQSARKAQFIKPEQSFEEHTQYCDILVQSLIALQFTLLCTIYAYLWQKIVGMQLHLAFKISLWATDDAQSICELHNLLGSDKNIVSSGRQKASDVLNQESKDIIAVNDSKKIAENLDNLFKRTSNQLQFKNGSQHSNKQNINV
ncbi:MAG: hypothetical protein EZS28_007169 [Streblomastix strix]|uniref:Uncharacterized protein n=1 Tax=Streblomastix strix TaxID=222440 RepID=A0A5J4WQH1_9EUKA|nr:MAG: hypothetical protein EZS28_007169 [Streblomastix strix]